MKYDLIHVTPLNPVIGAEIHGVDLSKPLGAATFKEIEAALHQHLVIFFRDQDLEPDVHMAFAARFGELEPPHPLFPKIESHPQISVLENDEARKPETNYWHTDVTWRETPPMGSVLYGAEIPESGGDTLWANMYAAYDMLPDALKAKLEGLRAIHSIEVFDVSANYDNAKDKDAFAEILKKFPPQSHPIVRTHPVTGRKALFVNATFTQYIEGMERAESDALLQSLYDIVKLPEVQVRFNWTKGAVAVWDNRATQHYAVADYWPQYRRMHRITINGDKPV
jgi:taurine dioxygenase